MSNKTFIYSLFVGFVTILSSGVFANVANAQYYDPYYSYDNTYPSLTGDQYYVNNYPPYPTYPNESLSFPNNSGLTCPPDFILTTYNGLFGCYKFLNQNTSNTFYPNFPNSPNFPNFPNFPNYNPTTPGLTPGCLPGYAYSIVTGRRCDDYYNNFYGNTDLRGRGGTIRNFDVRDGDDTHRIREGDNNAEVMEIRFEVRDGDIRLDRIEFNFEFTGRSSGEDLPWNTFDEIRLLYDGDEIDSMNADDRDDWDEEGRDTYSITFTNIGEILRENERANLTLEVDLDSNISGASSNNVSWDIFVPDRGLRARDGNNNTIYAGDDSDNVSIDIDEN